MKIILLGYMASGKTFVAKLLSKKTGLKHIDLDEYIEEKENLEIAKIFSKNGEIQFRLLENFYLNALLNRKDDFILSVGGGTPCYANNMELISEKSNSFYLKASIDTLYDRIIKEKKKRPLVAEIPDAKLKEFIAKHLFERSVFYNKAYHTIEVSDKSIEVIINEILLQI